MWACRQKNSFPSERCGARCFTFPLSSSWQPRSEAGLPFLQTLVMAMRRDLIGNVAVFCILVALGVGTRWISEANYVKLPNPAGDATNITDVGLANFTAIGACALFGGFFFHQRVAAFLLPLAIMVISNLCLRNYNNYGQMAIVYAALL